MSIRRAIKNSTKGYQPCEVDVREATSNDKTAASALVNARIANACYDVSSSRLVMDMVWKRLHDNGKNWRHVYKALMLVEYLLKTGPAHVVAEIQKNVFALTTLTAFQYTSAKSGVDKGLNVREHAKACLSLVQNEGLLRREREVGVRNHQRYTEVMGDQVSPFSLS
jgi:epsin